MGIIQDRIERVEALKRQIENHCMCLNLTEDTARYLVVYPSGFYPQGVQAAKGTNKAVALQRILNAMEEHWLASYPR